MSDAAELSTLDEALRAILSVQADIRAQGERVTKGILADAGNILDAQY